MKTFQLLLNNRTGVFKIHQSDCDCKKNPKEHIDYFDTLDDVFDCYLMRTRAYNGWQIKKCKKKKVNNGSI